MFRSFKFKTIFHILIISGLVVLIMSEPSWAGDIILTGNQVLLVENDTYSNKGNIKLYDESKLIIRNSTFNFIQDYHEQYLVELYGSTSLVIEAGSTFTSDKRFLVSMFGTSRVTVNDSTALNESLEWKRGAIFQPNNNSIFECNNSKLDAVGYMFAYSELTKATISIQNSTMQALPLHAPLASSVTLSNIRKGLIQNLQLLKQNTNLPYDLTISNTTIQGAINIWVKDSAHANLINCDFSQVTADQNASVSLIDSNVAQMFLEFSHDTFMIELGGLKPGPNLSYILDLSGSNSIFLQLNNTNVDGWVIKIVNCENSHFQIRNCRLNELRTIYGNFLVTVADSDIDEIWFWDFSGKIDFNNSVVGNWADTRNYPPATNNLLISGTVTFIKADLINLTLGNQWFSTIVRREFPCRVQADNPASATIEVRKPDGKLAFSGRPNRDGDLVTDDLIFDSTNYDKPWRIYLMYNSLVLDEQELRIATSTPIQLSTTVPLPEKKIYPMPGVQLLLLGE